MPARAETSDVTVMRHRAAIFNLQFSIWLFPPRVFFGTFLRPIFFFALFILHLASLASVVSRSFLSGARGFYIFRSCWHARTVTRTLLRRVIFVKERERSRGRDSRIENLSPLTSSSTSSTHEKRILPRLLFQLVR